MVGALLLGIVADFLLLDGTVGKGTDPHISFDLHVGNTGNPSINPSEVANNCPRHFRRNVKSKPMVKFGHGAISFSFLIPDWCSVPDHEGPPANANWIACCPRCLIKSASLYVRPRRSMPSIYARRAKAVTRGLILDNAPALMASSSVCSKYVARA